MAKQSDTAVVQLLFQILIIQQTIDPGSHQKTFLLCKSTAITLSK